MNLNEIKDIIFSNRNNLKMLEFKGKEESIYLNRPTTGKFSEIRDLINEDISLVEATYKVQCMLAVYYPPGGGLGWHTNADADMYNAIYTYSTSNKSYLQIMENKIMDSEDVWTVKTTYWSKENPSPHRVVAKGDRITITFSSPDKYKIEELINDIK